MNQSIGTVYGKCGERKEYIIKTPEAGLSPREGMPSAGSIPVIRIIEVPPGAGSVNAFSSRTRIHTLRAMRGGRICL